MTEKNTDTVKELNLEEKISIKSIAGWTTGFQRIESTGDVTIPKNGKVRLPRSEVISQVQSGNKLFTGTDGKGSHATLYIDDEPTRLEVEFDSKEENRVQLVLTPDVVEKMFSYKTIKTFKEKLEKVVVTRAEKYALTQIINKLKLNDHEKIRIVENYTGYKI